MMKKIFFWLAVLAAILMFVFLGWAFGQHGTIGLFRVNGTFQKLFIVLGVFGLVLLGLALLERRLQSRNKNAAPISFPYLYEPDTGGNHHLCLCLLLHRHDSRSAGRRPTPQLLIEDGSGVNGVPNLAIVFNTPKTTSNTVYGDQIIPVLH